ncbi:unnamed protein product [Ranitomeya imitator]|uniref:Ectonucleoside triphosphate diphosphohydrolase 3 n=1 Tax=Ranitomeya imitator TaxID=111125 RepID=A0ABN9L1H5_9NEOB|nr:unnamed protein product [Ranitomeya imitator]
MDLDKLETWAERWQMRFNNDKCKVIHMGRVNQYHHYTLNGKPLGKSDREKDLGILVNDKLTWSSQCQAAAAKANRIMGCIKRGLDTHDESIILPLYKSLYGIVLDAGSSRTTVYVYQWPAEKENNTGVVSQSFKCNVNGKKFCEYSFKLWSHLIQGMFVIKSLSRQNACSNQIQALGGFNESGKSGDRGKISTVGLGISSYASEPEKAAKNIDNCMKKVISVIPFNQQNSTPVYLGATAGMRLLRLKNESAAQGVLFSIENYFQTQPFDFRGAHIITGQEEGVYGWITVNYLMGNFLEKNVWSTWIRPDGAETTGALDLGGASTQISFLPEKSEQNPNSTLEVTLYGYKYNVYTHSFQCYGRDESEKRLLASLAKSSHGKSVENPCYPQNYMVNLTMNHIFGSLCSASFQPANYNPEQLISFKGTGEPDQCMERVATLFDFAACHGKQDCSFDGVYQPKVKGGFSAFSGFYYTANALNLTGNFQLPDFKTSMSSFCSQEWSKKNEGFAWIESVIKMENLCV